MKKQIRAKIGTHSSTILVLWDDKPYNVGDRIIAMEYNLYNTLHSRFRRLKSCGYWRSYHVDEISPILFVSK